jgi:predicted trehalose synthase
MCNDCEALEEEAEFYAQAVRERLAMCEVSHKRERMLARQLATLLESLRRVAREARGVGRN